MKKHLFKSNSYGFRKKLRYSIKFSSTEFSENSFSLEHFLLLKKIACGCYPIYF